MLSICHNNYGTFSCSSEGLLLQLSDKPSMIFCESEQQLYSFAVTNSAAAVSLAESECFY